MLDRYIREDLLKCMDSLFDVLYILSQKKIGTVVHIHNNYYAIFVFGVSISELRKDSD